MTTPRGIKFNQNYWAGENDFIEVGLCKLHDCFLRSYEGAQRKQGKKDSA